MITNEKFIDTHFHIDTYEEIAKETFSSLLEKLKSDENFAMPEKIVHIACAPCDFQYGKEISERYPFVYSAYAIHPLNVNEFSDENIHLLKSYLNHPKTVAIGEFGLDYHYEKESRLAQIKLFETELEIAQNTNLPLVLHLRECDDDALDILKNFDLSQKKIHVHCFTGTKNFVEKLLELNTHLFVGFTGIITFKNAPNVREAAEIVPLNQILLETDGPYMTPNPYRGTPAHPGHIPYIAKQIAAVKNIELNEVYFNCRKNTADCYGI